MLTMTHIETVDVLSGLKAALLAPEEKQLELFREQVAKPLKPFWEFPQGYGVPSSTESQDDPDVATAKRFGSYSPGLGVEKGLAALELLEKADSLNAGRKALEQAINALQPEKHGVELGPIKYAIMVMNPAMLREDYGSYSGFQRPGIVMVTAFPNAFNVPRLPAAATHELNHIVRFRYEPWTEQTTVGQYIIAEGLAEAFAVELFGEEIVGPYSTALSKKQLESVKPRFKEALKQTGDIRGFIFGDWAAEKFYYAKQGLPDFAGYTVGYEIVRAYTNRTGHSVAEATYLPWREIVEESKFFG
jgi:uncharacterized protein YjaZ